MDRVSRTATLKKVGTMKKMATFARHFKEKIVIELLTKNGEPIHLSTAKEDSNNNNNNSSNNIKKPQYYSSSGAINESFTNSTKNLKIGDEIIPAITFNTRDLITGRVSENGNWFFFFFFFFFLLPFFLSLP